MTPIGDVAASVKAAAEARPDFHISQIPFFVATARKLIATHHASEYQLWLALQHLNRQAGGSGWVAATGADLRALARLVGLSPVRVRYLLSSRSGLAWTKHDSRVHLVSQVRLAEAAARLALEARISDPLEPDTRCQMAPEELRGSLQSFKALIFDAWLAEFHDHRGQGGYLGTWKMLTRLWGHERIALSEWIRLAGVDKRPNMGLIRTPDLDPQPALENPIHPAVARELRSWPRWQRPDHDAVQGWRRQQASYLPPPDPDLCGFSHPGIWYVEHDHAWYLAYQRGNTYQGRTARRTGVAGKALKLNRHLRVCAGDLGEQAVWNALCEQPQPGRLLPRPDGSIGLAAGQLTQILSELDPTGGGTSGLVAAWRKLAAQGRFLRRKTNYQQPKPFRRARSRRRGENLHLLVHRSQPWPGSRWGVWLLAQAEDLSVSA